MNHNFDLLALKQMRVYTIDIERCKNRLLRFCYVPATSAAHNRLLFFLFLLQPFTVLMKQTRQVVRAIKQVGIQTIVYTLFIVLPLKNLMAVITKTRVCNKMSFIVTRN